MARDGLILAGYTAGRFLGLVLGAAGAGAAAAGHFAWYVSYLCDAGSARADEAVTAAHRALRGD